MKTPAYIIKHSNFSADDYEYLSAKGYSNKEILTIWNKDVNQGKTACQWKDGGFAESKFNSVVA